MNTAHTAENETPKNDDVVNDNTFSFTHQTSSLLGMVSLVTGMTIGAVVAAAIFAAKD